jgi:hypothetical protein
MESAAVRLAPVLRAIADAHAPFLNELKADAAKAYASLYERDDGLWHALIESFATWGGSRGWAGLVGNREKYNQVTLEAISSYAPAERVARLTATMLGAQVRYAAPKARHLVTNHALVIKMGGPKAARDKLLAEQGVDAKMAFLMRFAGIGPKYARNIFMDIYHPDFHDSIAIDSRVQSITTALGLTFKTYEAEEAFYVATGRRAGLNGWEVDRILYNFRDEVLRGVAK